MHNLIWMHPELHSDGPNPVHVWRTQCGRYRVARVAGPTPRFIALARVNLPGAKETELANNLRCLEAALDVVERHAAEDLGVRRIESNREAIEAFAERDGLDVRPYADLHLSPDEMDRRRASLARLLAKKAADPPPAPPEPHWPIPISSCPAVVDGEQEAAVQNLEKCIEPDLAIDIRDGNCVTATGVYPGEPQANGSTMMATKTKTAGTKATKGTKGTKAKTKKNDATEANVAPPKAKPVVGSKKLSALDAAHQILAKAGQPMTCPELIEAMAVTGLWTSPGGKTPAATLYAAIVTEIKKKADASRFVKAGPGKFAAR